VSKRPRGTCDTHVHVFDPARFPYALPRHYTPGTATVEDLRSHLARTGCERVLLVQPSTYGEDDRCLRDALARLGPAVARGITVREPATLDDATLAGLHAQGVRGLRLNLEVHGQADPGAVRGPLQAAARRLAGSGWCLQLHAALPLVRALADELGTLGVPVVLDHFAGLKAVDAPAPGAPLTPGLAAVLALLRTGRVNVKLSAAYRASTAGPAHDDLAPLVRAMATAAPERLLWGSDWPHTGGPATRDGDLTRIEPFRPENATLALDRLMAWLPDPALQARVLVHNPAALYGFDPIDAAPAPTSLP
jgi:predicted TIM-barrel fold metal-dependent hydrolase